MPLVSVVIPTRNRAHLLPAALRSALGQSFTDFEILVVDDGSTDRTPALRGQFDDPRLRWLRHESARGGGAARNAGIAAARGEYIAFLDDDDEWRADKLARQSAALAQSGADVGAVFTGYRVIDAASRKVVGRKVPSKSGDLYPDLLEGNYIGGTSCLMAKRSGLERLGGFDERLPSFQDYDLWLRMAGEFRFLSIAAPLVNYYAHEQKIWTNPDAVLAGLRLMLEKYGRSAAFRRYCSRLYLALGVRFAETGEPERARRAFLSAIALHPYGVRPYVYFGLSLGGLEAVAAARRARSKLRRWGARNRQRSIDHG